MYNIEFITQDISIPREAENIANMKPLLKSVLGYTDNQIEKMIERYFIVKYAAKNLDKEQVVLAFQPFANINAPMFISEYDDFTGKLINSSVKLDTLGIIRQTPQQHYYDEPIVPKDCLYSFDSQTQEFSITPKPEPQPSTPTITCPYCKSTDCKKISGLSKAGSVALWGIFALGKTTKQWHCNNCKSDF